MAGFVGICSKTLTTSPESVTVAVTATIYSAHTEAKDLLVDNHLILKKSSFRFLETSRMQAERDQVLVWIDGEIYNQDEIGKKPNEVFAEALLDCYKEGTLNNLLKKIDGVYLAIIYDKQKQQLHLITDRYGLKPFYVYTRDNAFIFAPELKCFPTIKPFTLEIRKDVVECFVQLEHMMGTATWFNGVEVTTPSTIYTYSWQDDTLTKSRYWSWSNIQRSSISLENAADEMGSLLDRAIKLRTFGDCRVGAGLSGGFDSRAILAAIHDRKPITYTFGIEDSADVQIANQVARLADVQNVHFDMHVDHWLQKRFNGVWKTDGMLNMYHMHYSHLMDEIPKIMDVNLSGFLGDGVLGQTYLLKKGKLFLNKRIDHATAQHYYGKHYQFSDPDDSFFNIPKVDAYLIYNRGRRLTGLGMEEANKTIHQRMPFMDNKLMDFSYSLPDEFRLNSIVYHRALILKYPEFYKDIPHATSGVPISLHPSILYKGKKFYHRWLWVVKYKLGIATSFTDVYNWIKEPDTANFIQQMLNPKHALYPNFTHINFLEVYVKPHLSGQGNHVKQVMSALTMELWLQQILNKKYLSAS